MVYNKNINEGYLASPQDVVSCRVQWWYTELTCFVSDTWDALLLEYFSGKCALLSSPNRGFDFRTISLHINLTVIKIHMTLHQYCITKAWQTKKQEVRKPSLKLISVINHHLFLLIILHSVVEHSMYSGTTVGLALLLHWCLDVLTVAPCWASVWWPGLYIINMCSVFLSQVLVLCLIRLTDINECWHTIH